MKFLILNSDYPEFMKWHYGTHPGLEEQSYEKQMQLRMESFFGTADFYSANLCKLGHEARDIIVNLEPAQKQWAKEHGIKEKKGASWKIRLRKGIVPWPCQRQDPEGLFSILEAQIKKFRPDIFYCMSLETVGSGFLKRVRPYYRIAVGQHAATPLNNDVSAYDLILSSLPNQVETFRRLGLRSELFRLGFEPRILEKVTHGLKDLDIVFAGGLGKIHEGGTKILSSLAERFDITVWGYGIEFLPKSSRLFECFRGPIWGIEMYQALCSSKIVFNRHSDLADREFANNMRLYEATGVGALLLTDYKPNLSEMFMPGKEVVVYRDARECIEQADYYLAHEEDREAVARAGQDRTLKEHNYYKRMQELVDIVKRYV